MLPVLQDGVGGYCESIGPHGVIVEGGASVLEVKAVTAKPSALCNHDAFGSDPCRHIGFNAEALANGMRRGIFGNRIHSGPIGEAGTIATKRGASFNPLAIVVDRQDIFLCRFHPEQILQFLEFRRVFRGQIVCRRKITFQVEQGPLPIFKARDQLAITGCPHIPSRALGQCASHPAILVDAEILHHFVNLRPPRRGCRALGEGVGKADPIQRLLRHALDHIGSLYAHGFQYGRCDIADMGILGTDHALFRNMLRP